MSLSQILQIRVGLQNFFQSYGATILPTRTAIEKQSLQKHAGGYWLYETEFEIRVAVKRLNKDNTDPQLGNIEREIQRVVCLHTPNDIDGVDDIFYRGQRRIYETGESSPFSSWSRTSIIIAVRYHSVNEEPF